MRFDGEWLQCDDGIVRPVLRAEILTESGHWRAFELLVDTGADRTVISANVLESLNLETAAERDRIGGIGGLVVRFRAKAEQDAAGHAEFIQRGNMDAAIRFLDAVADACALLSRMIGRQRDGEPERESRQGVRYFSVDRITRDQATDYARRKGVALREVEKWLAPNLGYESGAESP